MNAFMTDAARFLKLKLVESDGRRDAQNFPVVPPPKS